MNWHFHSRVVRLFSMLVMVFGTQVFAAPSKVAVGGYHTCAVLRTGEIQCWGYNEYGQLGNSTSTNSPTPVTVSSIGNAIAVSGADLNSCAVLASGAVQCWGYNEFGQLGNGTTTNSSTPVTVTGIINALAVSAGNSHTCAVLGLSLIHI